VGLPCGSASLLPRLRFAGAVDRSKVGRVVGGAFRFRDDMVAFETVVPSLPVAADGAGQRVAENDGACIPVGARAAFTFPSRVQRAA
jgi:hypothetical protein